MYSKIMIDLVDGEPAIRVEMKDRRYRDADKDLRDKAIRLFFDKLGSESSFLGVIPESEYPDNTKFIIPMTIPHVLEWLHRFFVEKKAKAPEEVGDIDEIFRTLGNYYYNEPVSTENPGIE